jgi:hypothetical protein
MKKNKNGRIWTKTATVFLALLMAAGLCACGGKKKEEQQAPKEETVAAAEAVETPTPEITPEAVTEKPEQQEVKPEETPAAETPAEEPAKEEEKETVTEAPQEPEVIKKPEAVDTGEPEEKTEKEAEDKEKKEKKASSNGLALLDGKMVFDGMDLEFPIELDSMKLGNWKIEFQNVEDPESKTLMPGEIVTAVMTNEAFIAEDVTVIAEFGNYSSEDTDLTDIPMTGIYLTKGKGKDGNEPVLPEVTMPGGLTWGSTESEIRDLFGEASLSGTFNMDFDFMYENGEYMVEFGGMDDGYYLYRLL